MFNRSENSKLPPINLITIDGGSSKITDSPKHFEVPPISDLRWQKVQEFLKSTSLSKNTQTVYKRELQRFLSWTDLSFRQMRSRHLANYKEYLLVEAKTPQGQSLSKATVNSALSTLKSFFSWMCLTYPDIIEANPMLGIKLEKLPEPKPQDLEQDKLEAIKLALEDFDGPTKLRDLTLLHILLYGLRANEVASLNIEDYDGKLILITETKDKKPRIVPLLRESRQYINNYLDTRSAGGEKMQGNYPLLLSYHNSIPEYTRIHEPFNARLSYQGIYTAIKRIGKLAGLPDLHPHAFRHTFASMLLLDGLDPTHARKLTGHSTDGAFKRYVVGAEQKAAISAFYKLHGED
jgi:integrase/recombinase XerD